MKSHCTPSRSEAALDLLLALILGIALGLLALAYFDVLWS